MENIIITKIINEYGDEFDVNWNLNTEKRRIEKSSMSYELVKEIFRVKEFKDIGTPNLILCSKDNSNYYCYNCIFGFEIFPKLCIYSISIDYILSNSKVSLSNLKIKKYEMHIELPKDIKKQYIDENIEFKYSKFVNVELTQVVKQRKCIVIIGIHSNRLMCAETLSSIAYNIYELLIIYFGIGIKILKIQYYEESKNIQLFSNIADKYYYGIRNYATDGIFVAVNKDSINKGIVNRFETFKRKTYLLNDVYLTITNTDTYKEIKINMMIQCIEGFYKSITGKKDKLHIILENVFLRNGFYNRILSKEDKRKVQADDRKETIFLFKAKNHRNYFSHLNENKRKILFNGFQLNYAYWKIVTTYRLILIKYLGTPYDEKALDKIISDINEYKKKCC